MSVLNKGKNGKGVIDFEAFAFMIFPIMLGVWALFMIAKSA